MHNNIALSEFVEFNKIKRDDFGCCRFPADVVIRASGNGGAETVDARISFASGDQEQVVLKAAGSFVAGKVPLGYSTDFGKWTHQDGVLTIKGNYRKLFDYITEIRPEVP